MMIIKIIIDTREKGPKDLPGTRKERAYNYYTNKNHKASITQLEYGDYLFDDQVCFEYKTIPDFLKSMFDKSLFEEVSNQTDYYPYSFVIIEGNLGKYLQKNWDDNKLTVRRWGGDFKNYYFTNIQRYHGAIRRLQTGAVVINKANEEQCFKEMLLQSIKCVDSKSYGGVTRGLKVDDNIDYFLSGCGGVSSKTIKDINETLHLNGLNDLLTLTIEDLTSVKGIGAKKALKIYEWIHKKRINEKTTTLEE